MDDLRPITRKIQRLVGAEDDGLFGPNTAVLTLAALESGTALPVTPPEPPEECVLDARTRRNLDTLLPKARAKFKPFILRAKAVAAAMGCEYRAISGTRGEKEQNALYAKGRTTPGPRVTNARYGYSNHNFGIALDFGVFKGRQYLDGADPPKAAAVHRAVGALAAQYGIDWGGEWRRFKDLPHFEVRTGLTLAQKRARLKAGTPIL